MSYCRVFWGSHGCGLERGHAGWLERHVCGDAGDGPCSEIRWVQDPRTGLWIWDQRYWTSDGPEPDDVPYPAMAFGEDLPPGQLVSLAAVDTVHAVRQSAGELPVMRDGKWVRAGDGAPWPG